MSLDDFATEPFAADGKTRTIYRRGTGPAVIVMTEMPGISPKVVELAERIVGIGCTAVLPHLFGDPGRDALEGGRFAAAGYFTSSMIPACISREFTVFATGKTSPVVSWLRQLAIAEHERCGGPGVGTVGMCFTGGFALAMATIPTVLAPVMSQPSLPMPIRNAAKAAIDLSDADLDLVKDRCANDGLTVVGLRFKGDRFVPPARFQFLREQLGAAFVSVELDDSCANPDGALSPHSVLTEHLIDEPGQPTHDALQVVLDLFRTRLLQ